MTSTKQDTPMYISILGSIATNDLLTESAQQKLGTYPKGQAGAPLISNLIKEYLSRGHKVLAVTLDDQLADDEPPFVYEEGLLTFVIAPKRKHTFRPNGKRPGRTADFFRFERDQLLAILKQYKPDVVHAHWTYEYAAAALAYTPEAVITVHDNALVIFKYVRTLNRFFHLLLARYVFRRGRRFTAVSPYMAASVQQWTKSPVTVVANPVPMPKQRSTSTSLDAPIISMVVNGWDDRKNNKKALLAFKGIQQIHPTAVLWAFGTAFEPGAEADAFCREHQIPNVVLHGMTPYTVVLEKVAQSTLLLHASLEESFGMVLAEAMSYGIPVVGGKDSGAVAWVVEDGGLLVDVTKIEEMVGAVDTLLSDQPLYEQCSANAIRVIKTRFPVEHIADQFLALYPRAAARTEPSERTSPARQLSLDSAYKG